MNRTVKGIIAGCGALVVLGGGLAVLELTKPTGTEESSAPADNCVELWNVESDDISKIIVKHPDGETYTVNRKMEQVEDTDMDGNTYMKDVANYYLEGYEKLPMNTVTIRTLATRNAYLSTSDTVQTDTPESDLAKYGLDKPIEVTMKVDGSDDICFLLGNNAPNGSQTYFCTADDKKTVYVVALNNAEPYQYDMLFYLGTQVTEEQADDDERIVEQVRVERKDLDYDFVFKYDDAYHLTATGGSSAVHIMEEPVRCLLNAEKSADATHGLFGLTAVEVLTPFPTEEDMAKAGLDDPFVRVTMNLDDGTEAVFRMGNTYEAQLDGGLTETRYYAYYDGIECIYGFSPDGVIYDDMKPEDLTSKMIVETYVWDIGRLTYTAGDLTLDFKGSGSSDDDYVVTLNGETTETERFRVLYTYLLKAAAEDLVLEDVTPPAQPMAAVRLERQDGKRTYDFKFYDAGGMKAYIAVDDEIVFKCRKSYVETLITNMKMYDETDKDFIMTW